MYHFCTVPWESRFRLVKCHRKKIFLYRGISKISSYRVCIFISLSLATIRDVSLCAFFVLERLHGIFDRAALNSRECHTQRFQFGVTCSRKKLKARGIYSPARDLSYYPMNPLPVLWKTFKAIAVASSILTDSEKHLWNTWPFMNRSFARCFKLLDKATEQSNG